MGKIEEKNRLIFFNLLYKNQKLKYIAYNTIVKKCIQLVFLIIKNIHYIYFQKVSSNQKFHDQNCFCTWRQKKCCETELN